MSKEDRRQYIFAQLGSLPNAMQYVEVTKYIEDLEQQVKKQQEINQKAIEYINQHWVIDDPVLFKNDLLEILEDKEV